MFFRNSRVSNRLKEGGRRVFKKPVAKLTEHLKKKNSVWLGRFAVTGPQHTQLERHTLEEQEDKGPCPGDSAGDGGRHAPRGQRYMVASDASSSIAGAAASRGILKMPGAKHAEKEFVAVKKVQKKNLPARVQSMLSRQSTGSHPSAVAARSITKSLRKTA